MPTLRERFRAVRVSSFDTPFDATISQLAPSHTSPAPAELRAEPGSHALLRRQSLCAVTGRQEAFKVSRKGRSSSLNHQTNALGSIPGSGTCSLPDVLLGRAYGQPKLFDVHGSQADWVLPAVPQNEATFRVRQRARHTRIDDAICQDRADRPKPA